MTLSSKAQTWVYHPFPDSSAIWNIDSHAPCGLFFDSWEHLYSIRITGDTIIKSINYRKLTVPIQVIVSNGGCAATGSWTNPGYYAGGVRQDIPNKKVFFIRPTDTTEQLLYDFNMAVGDTVKGYTETFASPSDTVQSIDSVLVGGLYRKRWKLNSCYNFYFIEGIGSTFGLMGLSPGCITDGGDYSLTCFHQNGQTLYPSTAANCELITSVNTAEKKSNQINISPNPSNGSFIIDFDKSIKEIRITDLLGNIIIRHETHNQSKLKIDNLQSGTYILTAIDMDGGTTNKKLIVQ